MPRRTLWWATTAIGRSRACRKARARAARLLCVPLILAIASACTAEKQKELKPGAKSIILTGAVSPVQESEVTAPIAALVSQILVAPGQGVRAKQVIVRLDPTPYQADVMRAEATLALARAELAQARAGTSEPELAEARADVERLEQELDRQKRLAALPRSSAEHERARIILDNAKARLERLYALFAKRVVSRAELETGQNEYADAWQRYQSATEALEGRETVRDSDVRIAQARYDAARARLHALETGGVRPARVASAEAQIRQAEADLSRARYHLAQTTVLAPIGGTVVEVKAQVGEKVEERSPLLGIKDISRVQVKAELSPGLLPHVHVGQRATVTVNTVPPSIQSATVHTIQPVADAKTQSLGMTFILANPDLKFQPGFTARVEIPVTAAVATSPAR